VPLDQARAKADAKDFVGGTEEMKTVRTTVESRNKDILWALLNAREFIVNR
jgi:hypothetical protein